MAARRPSFSETPVAAPSESLFARLIVAPVLFVSFLLSLFFIDRKTYGGIFGQDHQSKDGYYHSHQRKLAKHDVDEAFRAKNNVIIAMAVSSGVGLAIAGWVVSRVYAYVMHP